MCAEVSNVLPMIFVASTTRLSKRLHNPVTDAPSAVISRRTNEDGVTIVLLIAYLFYLFSLALQPSVGYGLLWLCSPAWAIAFCGSAAQRGLWPSVALQPSVGYGLLWLCSPARATASCGSAAQRGLRPSVALQPSVGYGLLWLSSPAWAMAFCGCAAQRRLWLPRPRGFLITHNDAPHAVGLLWTSGQLFAETST
jgi:hypothetical protein